MGCPSLRRVRRARLQLRREARLAVPLLLRGVAVTIPGNVLSSTCLHSTGAAESVLLLYLSADDTIGK